MKKCENSFTKRRINRYMVINSSMLSMTTLLLCAVVVAVFAQGPRLGSAASATASNYSSVVQLLKEDRAAAGSNLITKQLTLQRTFELSSSSSLLLAATATTLDSSFKTKKSSSSIATSSAIPDYELQALKDLYDSTDGDDWVWKGKHWDFSDITQANPCDTWQGITCSITRYHHVTSINLPGCNLVGSLPSSLGLLSELLSLSLFMNKLTGLIPASLGQLTKLTHLTLFSNGLTGSLPESLGNMISMQFLSVSENSLDGTLPLSLGQLSQLISLEAGYNQFQGTIPNSLGDLTQLDEIGLSNNHLNGIVPSSLCKYHHHALNLYGNMFVCYPECLESAVTILLVVGKKQFCDDILISLPTSLPISLPTSLPTSSVVNDSSSSSNRSKKTSLSIGTIIGIVGTLIIAACIVALCIYYYITPTAGSSFSSSYAEVVQCEEVEVVEVSAYMEDKVVQVAEKVSLV